MAIFEGRILGVGLEEAEIWGRLCPHERLPDVDGLMAATAIRHDLVVASRNTKDFVRAGVEVVNEAKAKNRFWRMLRITFRLPAMDTEVPPHPI